MKLVEDKEYILKFPDSEPIIVHYECYSEGSNYYCDLCGKEHVNSFQFGVGDIGNPTERYTFGSTCVKKVIKEKI